MAISDIKITSPNHSQLKFLRPLVSTVLEIVDQTYIQNTKIPCWLLPTSGKEIAMTPLYYHAAFEAYSNKTVSYIPSAEIQIPRGISKGRLDLALVGREHIELIELKASRVSLFGSTATILNKISEKQYAAKDQLAEIDHTKINESTDLITEDLTIVTLFLLAPEEKAKNRFKVENRIKEIMSCIKEDFPYALRASLLYSKMHQINLDSSQEKGEQSVGMIVVASRTIDIK